MYERSWLKQRPWESFSNEEHTEELVFSITLFAIAVAMKRVCGGHGWTTGGQPTEIFLRFFKMIEEL